MQCGKGRFQDYNPSSFPKCSVIQMPKHVEGDQLQNCVQFKMYGLHIKKKILFIYPSESRSVQREGKKLGRKINTKSFT